MVQIGIKTIEQSEECHLGRVGNIGEHRMFHIVVNRLQYRGHKKTSQLLAFVVNVLVTSPAEIDALECAFLHFLRLIDLLQAHLAFFVDQDSLSRLQLVHIISRYIQGCLNHRTLGRQHNDFIILVPESGTDTPRVAHGKGFAATRQSADDITSVPILA